MKHGFIIGLICGSMLIVLSVVTIFLPTSSYAVSLNADPNSTELGLPQATDVDQSISSGRINLLLSTMFAVATLISVLFIAIGGFKYTMSGGDPNALSSAKNTIIYAIIGLAVTVSVFVIIRFVLGNF